MRGNQGRATVYMRVRPSFDAGLALWALRRFAGFGWVDVKFVDPKSIPAALHDSDYVLGMPARHHGLVAKARSAGYESMFRWVVVNYASSSDQLALAALVDEAESTVREARNPMPEGGRMRLSSFLAALLEQHDARTAVAILGDICDGWLKRGHARQRGAAEARTAERRENGRLAVISGGDHWLTRALLADGVKVVVFEQDNAVGVVTRVDSGVRVDGPRVRALIREHGEQIGNADGTWFISHRGDLVAWGTETMPASQPSKVPVEELIEMAAADLRAQTIE